MDQKQTFSDRVLYNGSNKKTSVGDLAIKINDNEQIYLQRVLDVKNVYVELKKIISKQ